MALPRFTPDASPPAGLASVLANIQLKLPGIRVPTPSPIPVEPESNPQPITPIPSVHCTDDTKDGLTNPLDSNIKASIPRQIFTVSSHGTGQSAYGYLYLPTVEGERWRESAVEKRYPKLNKYLKTVRRVLLSPLARFLILDTNPPRGCLIECETHEMWSECVGENHGEFMGDLS
jgi:hypothetical protein